MKIEIDIEKVMAIGEEYCLSFYGEATTYGSLKRGLDILGIEGLHVGKFIWDGYGVAGRVGDCYLLYPERQPLKVDGKKYNLRY